MKSLLRSYFYRQFHSVGFYVQIGIVFGLSLIVGLIMLGAGAFDPAQAGSYNKASAFLFGWTGQGILNGIPWIPLTLFAFSGAMNYRAEVTSGALRNYIVSGHSRKQIFFGLYVGNLASYLFLQFATFLGVGLIGVIASKAPGEGFDGGSFALCVALVTFCDLALFTFFYSLFSLMKGHGFSGPLGVIIYVGLSTAVTIVDLILAIQAQSGDVTIEAYNTFLSVTVWIFPSLRDMLAGGNINYLPSGLLSMMAQSAEGPVNNFAMNLSAAIIVPSVIGIGSFILSLIRFSKSDFK